MMHPRSGACARSEQVTYSITEMCEFSSADRPFSKDYWQESVSRTAHIDDTIRGGSWMEGVTQNIKISPDSCRYELA